MIAVVTISGKEYVEQTTRQVEEYMQLFDK
jgi:hypothetical protein